MIGRLKSSDSVEAPELKSFDDFDLRLGDLMRGERATLGKSLLDVQRELKIKATYIAAIENCDPSSFETPGFIAGYVRSYARYLNMDPEWAFKTFCAESGFQKASGISAKGSGKREKREPIVSVKSSKDPLADPNASFVPRSEAVLSGIEPGALGSIAVLAGLIALIGFGGWSVLQEVQRVQFAPADQSTAEVAFDPLAEPEVTVMSDAQAEALDRLYRPNPLETPVIVARDGPIAAVDPAIFGSFSDMGLRGDSTFETETESAAPEAAETPIRVTEQGKPVVRLVAVRPAWVRVLGAGGTVLFESVMNAGQEYELPQTDEPPMLRVGESGAVYFNVGGQHFGPAGPSGTVTAEIVLSADALTETYSVADLTQDDDLARVVAEAAAVAAVDE